MKVLVVDNMVPFVRGSTEAVADHLVANLATTPGLSAELLRIPLSGAPQARAVEELMLCRMMELYWVDRVIGLRFPAYLIPHDHKTVWLMRDAHIPEASAARKIPDMAMQADRTCFAASRQIFVASRAIQQRLHDRHGAHGSVLWPPLGDPERFANRSTGDYVFACGRIGPDSPHLPLIEALKSCRTGVRLMIAGVPDTGADADTVRAAASDPAVEARVQLDIGCIDREKHAAFVNNALACVDLPGDAEGPSSFIMEACHAAKPVIVSVAARGALDMVRDRETGFVIEPTPEQLARAMDTLFQDRRQAEQLGRAARALLLERDISWPNAIERLMS